MKAIKSGAARTSLKVAGLGAIGALAVGAWSLVSYITRKPVSDFDDLDGYTDLGTNDEED